MTQDNGVVPWPAYAAIFDKHRGVDDTLFAASYGGRPAHVIWFLDVRAFYRQSTMAPEDLTWEALQNQIHWLGEYHDYWRHYSEPRRQISMELVVAFDLCPLLPLHDPSPTTPTASATTVPAWVSEAEQAMRLLTEDELDQLPYAVAVAFPRTLYWQWLRFVAGHLTCPKHMDCLRLLHVPAPLSCSSLPHTTEVYHKLIDDCVVALMSTPRAQFLEALEVETPGLRRRVVAHFIGQQWPLMSPQELLPLNGRSDFGQLEQNGHLWSPSPSSSSSSASGTPMTPPPATTTTAGQARGRGRPRKYPLLPPPTDEDRRRVEPPSPPSLTPLAPPLAPPAPPIPRLRPQRGHVRIVTRLPATTESFATGPEFMIRTARVRRQRDIRLECYESMTMPPDAPLSVADLLAPLQTRPPALAAEARAQLFAHVFQLFERLPSATGSATLMAWPDPSEPAFLAQLTAALAVRLLRPEWTIAAVRQDKTLLARCVNLFRPHTCVVAMVEGGDRHLLLDVGRFAQEVLVTSVLALDTKDYQLTLQQGMVAWAAAAMMARDTKGAFEALWQQTFPSIAGSLFAGGGGDSLKPTSLGLSLWCLRAWHHLCDRPPLLDPYQQLLVSAARGKEDWDAHVWLYGSTTGARLFFQLTERLPRALLGGYTRLLLDCYLNRELGLRQEVTRMPDSGTGRGAHLLELLLHPQAAAATRLLLLMTLPQPQFWLTGEEHPPHHRDTPHSLY